MMASMMAMMASMPALHFRSGLRALSSVAIAEQTPPCIPALVAGQTLVTRQQWPTKRHNPVAGQQGRD